MPKDVLQNVYQMSALDISIYGNSLQRWLLALLLAFAIVSICNFSKHVIAKRIQKIAEKTETEIDDFVVVLIQETRSFFFIGISVFLFGTLLLTLPSAIANILKLLPIFAFLAQLGIWGQLIISFLIQRYIESRPSEEEQLVGKTMSAPLRFVALLFLWTILSIVALDNLGMDITALITGLGVGGVAVALAVQNILGDLFAALSIVLDKPFVLGDFIIVDDLLGTVEHIGLKTTRIRSLNGEQLVFSNSDLLKSRIRNYKRMFERRVVFRFGVSYQTQLNQLKRIPGILREIIEALESTRFDRAHFAQYGDSSLDFEVVYYVTSPDYNLYMDIQQQVNLKLFHIFEDEGIKFAHPTRTIHLTHNAKMEAYFSEKDLLS